MKWILNEIVYSSALEDKIIFIDIFPDLIKKLEIEDIIEIYSPIYLKFIYDEKVKFHFYLSIG